MLGMMVSPRNLIPCSRVGMNSLHPYSLPMVIFGGGKGIGLGVKAYSPFGMGARCIPISRTLTTFKSISPSSALSYSRNSRLVLSSKSRSSHQFIQKVAPLRVFVG